MKVLELKDVKKTFQKNKKTFTAVDGVSFSIEKGECIGLVGESGCGKSTIARMVTHLEQTTSGEIFMNERNVTKAKGKELRNLYQNLQMVFQNPSDSFNPSEIKRTVAQLLEQVGLKSEFASRYPHEVSGGQCQRAAIARAIAIQPDLLICDEATSALDVSVQAQIVDLILKLRHEMNMSYLFISHDLALVQSICDRVLVMHRGRIVEEGNTQDVIEYAAHPYTKLLLSSVFPIHPDTQWQIPSVPQVTEEEGDACRFWQRCPHCKEQCKKERPQLKKISEHHSVACHFVE